jgi:hypothetical protein
LAISREFDKSVDWLLTGKTHTEPKKKGGPHWDYERLPAAGFGSKEVLGVCLTPMLQLQSWTVIATCTALSLKNAYVSL